MASGSGCPCPCEPQVHLAPVVDLIIFSLESITIHRYSHTVAGVQLLALLHYIELQFRNSRPIHVTIVNPCLCMASAYDLSCVLKFVKIFVLKFFFGCAQACTIHERDLQTDRQTPADSKYRAAAYAYRRTVKTISNSSSTCSPLSISS